MGVCITKSGTVLAGYWSGGRVRVMPRKVNPYYMAAGGDLLEGSTPPPSVYFVSTAPAMTRFEHGALLYITLAPNPDGGEARVVVDNTPLVDGTYRQIPIAWGDSTNLPANFFDTLGVRLRLNLHGQEVGDASRWEIIGEVALVDSPVEVALIAYPNQNIIEAIWRSGASQYIYQSSDEGETWRSAS